MKTATRRFCGAALDQATGPESGAWATYTSELKLGGNKTMPIYSVSHRQGESVHKFVTTCGTTIRGSAHLATFEDEEDRVYASDDTKSSSRASALASSMTGPSPSRASTGTIDTGSSSWAWRSG